MTPPPASPDPFAGDDDPFASILEGLADARVDEAAAARERAGWAVRRAEEAATFAAALVDLAERRSDVRLQLRGRREIVGTLRAVGGDAVALATPTGRAFVRLGHVVAVRTGPRHGLVPSRARLAPGRAGSRTMHDVLCDAAAERSEVHLVFEDGSEARGNVRAMGADVLTLRENSATGATVLVSFDAVAAVTLLGER